MDDIQINDNYLFNDKSEVIRSIGEEAFRARNPSPVYLEDKHVLSRVVNTPRFDVLNIYIHLHTRSRGPVNRNSR